MGEVEVKVLRTLTLYEIDLSEGVIEDLLKKAKEKEYDQTIEVSVKRGEQQIEMNFKEFFERLGLE